MPARVVALQEHGVFWFASSPDQRFPGRLQIADNLITLTLYDRVPEVKLNLGSVWTSSQQILRESRIYGWLPDIRRQVTLLDATAITIAIPNSERTLEYDAEAAIVGGHFDDISLNSLSIEFDILRHWLPDPPVQISNNDGVAITATVRYQEVATAEIDGATIALAKGGEHKTKGATVELKHVTSLRIRSPGITLESMFYDWVRPLHDFLIVAIGRPVTITGLLGKIGQYPRTVDIYTRLVMPRPDATPQVIHLDQPSEPALLFPYGPDCSFSDFMPAWLTLRQELLDTVIQVCGPTHAEFMFAETRYSNTFQSAEALAKRRFRTSQLEGREHALRVGQIVEAARAADVPEDHVTWAENILRNKNDRPLRELVSDLLVDSGLFSEEQGRHLGKKMASARAGVSHGGADGGIDAGYRYWLGELLRWVVRAYLIREIGAPKENILSRIQNNIQFKRAISEICAHDAAAARLFEQSQQPAQ